MGTTASWSEMDEAEAVIEEEQEEEQLSPKQVVMKRPKPQQKEGKEFRKRIASIQAINDKQSVKIIFTNIPSRRTNNISFGRDIIISIPYDAKKVTCNSVVLSDASSLAFANVIAGILTSYKNASMHDNYNSFEVLCILHQTVYFLGKIAELYRKKISEEC